jgi:hypothetical protein
MREKQRASAVSSAKSVIARCKIFDPITVGLARDVLDYEAALSELIVPVDVEIKIVRETG